jgi:hypothetical protein
VWTQSPAAHTSGSVVFMLGSTRDGAACAPLGASVGRQAAAGPDTDRDEHHVDRGAEVAVALDPQ